MRNSNCKLSLEEIKSLAEEFEATAEFLNVLRTNQQDSLNENY